ncbi:hypothetical protein lerEdw1_011109 [Lerista edwardsae]|nr:hypothetical protein lerEdw1_011109 [Lerista edwardsae]
MRPSGGPSRSVQAPAATRKFPSSQVYWFKSGQSDSEASEEELDVMELRARGKEQPRRGAPQERVGDVVLLEREVLEGDTVNRLALQFGCKVADIKRVNNFMQEQDLYALKSVKIPVKANGILTESSDAWQAAPPAGGPLATARSDFEDGGSSCGDEKQLDQYFRGVDQNVEAAARVGVSLSTDCRSEAPAPPPLGRKAAAGGGDCGIQWWNAVCLMLLVGIVLPVFCIVYFKSQEPEQAPRSPNATLPGNGTLPAAQERPPARPPARPSLHPGRLAKAAARLPSGG